MKKKILLLVLIATCSITSIKAQIAFSKEYGGLYNEDGRWMEQMPDSGFILVGGTTTFSNGQMDIWLVRTDAYGNELWTKSIGSTLFDFANMVKPLPDGFIICGVTNRNGDDDAIMVKTNLAGNTIWTNVLDDAGIQWFEGVVPAMQGGFTAVGVNTGTGTHGTYDIYLVRFNAAGGVIWQKNIGGQSYEIGNSIQQTPDGGYIIAGQTYSYGNLDGDYYLVRTDSSGNVLWEKTYGEPHLQECHYAAYTPDGGYIMVGDADTVTNGLGDTDIWIIKTDSNGNKIWEKIYGGSKKDGGKTIENTSDGGFIVAGITRSFGLINPNYYLVKLNSTGDLDWQKTSYGSQYHDHAYRAIETSDFGFAEFGYFKNSAGAQNYSLVKLPPNAGITKDIAVDDILVPKTTLCRSNDVNFVVQLTNYGGTNEQAIIVTMQIDNGTTVTSLVDTFPGTIAPTNSANLTFTQTYNFDVDGAYTLKAFVHHRNSDISYTNDTNSINITVIPPTSDPTTTSAVECNNASLTLSSSPAAAADSMFWYDAPSGGSLISTGNSYTTPTINSTETYYVQSEKGKGSKTGAVDKFIGTGSTSSGNHLKFDSRRSFKLVSVLVYPSVAGNRTIELRNSGGNVLQTKTINLPSAPGGIRVYLNFDVPQGNDLQLALTNGSAALFRNQTGAMYPYSVSQVLEMYGSSSANAGTYYYFYDWYVFVPGDNCESNRVPVQAIIGSGSASVFDGSRCGPGTVTLTANSTSQVSWYSASSGGTLLGNFNTYTTPSINSTTTYYLEVGTCPNRIAVDAIVNSTPSAPNASDVTHCGPGTVTLTATSSSTIYWYSAASNGVLVHTGSPFTTPFLNASDTYYAVAGSACPSSPTAVTAIISGSVINSVTDATDCGPASVTISASSSDPISWYANSTGGSPLATNTSTYTTPVLAQPVTYYAQAGTSCPSARRAVIANVISVDSPVGSGASRCGQGTLVVSAQSINPVTWWSSSTGGSQVGSGQIFTTPSLSSTTIYYAQASANGCNSPRTAVTATVNITTPPIPTSGAHCGPGHVALSATASDSIFWYSAASGGSSLHYGTTYTTPTISTTTTYYVQAGGVCPSVRVAVNAVIQTTSADPTIAGDQRCGTGTVILFAFSSDPINWYSTIGGSVIGTGSSFTTPSISSTTTYYAVAGASGCESNPVAVVATINPQPADPIVSGDQNCGPGQVTLTATSTNFVTWFSQQTGGNTLATGLTYTATYSTTTTVYAQASLGICLSNRIPVTGSIYTPPIIDLGPPVISINHGSTITLDPGPGFASYLWSTTATTQSINVNSDGTYKVVVTDAHNCQASDSIVVNVINPGIAETELDKNLSIYPNPTSGMVNITMNNPSLEFDLQITDVEGKIIHNDRHHNRGIFAKNYDLSNLAKGLYYVRIFSKEGNVTRTLLVQ